MGVGEAGQHQAGQPEVLVGRRYPGLDPHPAAAVGDQPDLLRDATGQPAVGCPVAAHPASSATTDVSARTPAWQSSSSACSAGECEMPLGLRTNSMAVGMPALAR